MAEVRSEIGTKSSTAMQGYNEFKIALYVNRSYPSLDKPFSESPPPTLNWSKNGFKDRLTSPTN